MKVLKHAIQGIHKKRVYGRELTDSLRSFKCIAVNGVDDVSERYLWRECGVMRDDGLTVLTVAQVNCKATANE